MFDLHIPLLLIEYEKSYTLVLKSCRCMYSISLFHSSGSRYETIQSRSHGVERTTHFYSFHQPKMADRGLYLFNAKDFDSNQELPAQIRRSDKWRHADAPHFTSRRGCEAPQGDAGKFLQTGIWPLIRATIYSTKCDFLMKRRVSGERSALRCFNQAFPSTSA